MAIGRTIQLRALANRARPLGQVPNRCHWFVRIRSNHRQVSNFHTARRQRLEAAKKTAQEDASRGKGRERFEYGAVVQFPVSVDPVPSYLPVSASTKSHMRNSLYCWRRKQRKKERKKEQVLSIHSIIYRYYSPSLNFFKTLLSRGKLEIEHSKGWRTFSKCVQRSDGRESTKRYSGE